MTRDVVCVDGAPRTARALWLAGSAALLALLIVVLATSRNGPGLYSDSIAFLSAAEGLASGRGFTIYNGEPYVQYAPLYPILLAGAAWLGVEADDAARWLQASMFAATVLLVGLWLGRYFGTSRWTWLGVAVIVTSPSLYEQSIVVFSEPLFILCAMLCLRALVAYLRHEWRYALPACVVFAALACLARYIGITLLLAGGLLMLADPTRAPRVRFRNAVAFGLVSALPTLLWIGRNVAVSGTTTGERFASPYGASEVLASFLATIGSWFVLPRAPGVVHWAVGGGLLVGVAAALLLYARGALRDFAIGGRLEGSPGEAHRQTTVVVSALFIAIYVPFLIAALSSRWTPSNHSRMLAPVVAPLVLVLVPGLAQLGPWLAARLGVWARHAPAIAVVMLLVWPARSLVGSVQYAKAHGAGGFAADGWRTSPLIAELRAYPLGERVYANDPNALHVLAGIDSAFHVPYYGDPGGAPTPVEALQRLAAQLEGRDSAVVVMFSERILEHVRFTPAELSTVFHVDVLASTDDGGIYRIHPRESRVAAP